MKAPPARLFLGALYGQSSLWEEVLAILVGRYGPPAGEIMQFPFTSDTAYYEKEMGEGLTRAFCVFGDILPQDALADIKRETMVLEKRFSNAGCRRVNLDPGMLAMDKLVLATGKEYSHRICIGGGLHAEVELLCRDGRMQSLEWTYPDYRTTAALDFFDRARLDLREALRTERAAKAEQ